MLNNSALGAPRLRIKQPIYTSDKRAKFTQRENKKWIRICTVIGYIFFVSLPAASLSFYYTWIWDPDYISRFPPDKNQSLTFEYRNKSTTSTKENNRQQNTTEILSAPSVGTTVSMNRAPTTSSSNTEMPALEKPLKVVNTMLKKISPPKTAGQRVITKPEHL